MSNLKAFILAAGLGERLRPITLHTPKALVPIAGRPAIEIVLNRIKGLSLSRIGVNASYKRDIIERWLKESPYYKDIEFFPEPYALGTGGALKNAEGFLEGFDFIVHNSDIISDIELSLLIDKHKESGCIATLAVHKKPEFNNLILDDSGFLRGIKKKGDFAFTGIAIYSDGFLKLLPSGASPVTQTWLRALKMGFKISTLDVTGSYWADIGTPSRYASAVFYEIQNRGQSRYISPDTICKDVTMSGFISLERGSEVEKGSALRNVIVLEGVKIKSAKRYENAIIGRDFCLDFNEKDALEFLLSDDGFLIGTGGSGRRYYRVSEGVLLKCPKPDEDFYRHIEYSKFFLRHNVPLPRLLRYDDKGEALFEDLGDTTLYNALMCEKDNASIIKLYESALYTLTRLHTIDIAKECPPFALFDYEHFRWETSYFLDRYVRAIRGIDIDEVSLERDLRGLAQRADSFPKGIVHRDFQSQNIMIKGGEAVIIDYQGARIGPTGYDIASILWDPYYRLDDYLRERLLDFYISIMKEYSPLFDESALRESLPYLRLQRHMQALGAYGNLSLKGKRYFLRYVPEGLRLLKEDIKGLRGQYPELSALVDRL